jgi:hypothetical protein
MLTDKVVEQIFSAEVAEQKQFVEEQSIILKELLDSELEDTSTSFLWCSNKMKIIITDDIFRRKRKFRQVINDDNDRDDEQDSVRLKSTIVNLNRKNKKIMFLRMMLFLLIWVFPLITSITLKIRSKSPHHLLMKQTLNLKIPLHQNQIFLLIKTLYISFLFFSFLFLYLNTVCIS